VLGIAKIREVCATCATKLGPMRTDNPQRHKRVLAQCLHAVAVWKLPHPLSLKNRRGYPAIFSATCKLLETDECQVWHAFHNHDIRDINPGPDITALRLTPGVYTGIQSPVQDNSSVDCGVHVLVITKLSQDPTMAEAREFKYDSSESGMAKHRQEFVRLITAHADEHGRLGNISTDADTLETLATPKTCVHTDAMDLAIAALRVGLPKWRIVMNTLSFRYMRDVHQALDQGDVDSVRRAVSKLRAVMYKAGYEHDASKSIVDVPVHLPGGVGHWAKVTVLFGPQQVVTTCSLAQHERLQEYVTIVVVSMAKALWEDPADVPPFMQVSAWIPSTLVGCVSPAKVDDHPKVEDERELQDRKL
jgi:hypothetical protein